MLKKLRLKFMLIAFGCLTFLFVVLYGTLNVTNYAHTLNQLDNICLSLYSKNEEIPSSEHVEVFEYHDDKNNQNNIKFKKSDPPYYSRFFVVWFDIKNGDLIESDFTHSNLENESNGQSYASFGFLNLNKKGFKNQYRYLSDISNKNIGVAVFLDASPDLKYVSTVALFSLISALIAWSGGLLFIYFLSGAVIKPIDRSMEKQKEFITNASHELKTPISVITTNLKLIEMENPKSKWVKKSEAQLNRLTDLVNELVTISKFDEGIEDIDVSDIDFSSTTNETIDAMYPLINQAKLSLVYEIEENIKIKANENNIKAILLSLFDNAIKYANKNSTIHVNLKKIKKTAVFEITNSADGLEKKDEQKLFERFYRKDETRTDKKGFGVGLSIVSKLVDMNQGKIKATINDNTITFSLIFKTIY